MPGKNGGKLKRGNTKNTGRPTSVVRARVVKGFAAALPWLIKVAKTGKDPDDGDKVVSRAERTKAIEVLGKFGIGQPVEVGGPDGAPFTVLIGMAARAGD